MSMVEFANGLGLPMKSIYLNQCIGWTTNEEIAAKMRDAGARVITGYGVDPLNSGQPAGGQHRKSKDTPMGWDISFRPGAIVLTEPSVKAS